MSRVIAVFGSSEPAPGEPLYETARELGRRLAAAGYGVLSGGYGGVMEGASFGAVEGGGAPTGVTCAIFSARTPNPYLVSHQETPDLLSRTAALVDGADGYVVLPGGSGTLAELAWLWALHRAGSLARRPVVLLGRRWGPFLEELAALRMIADRERSITEVADSPEEAVERLDRFFAAEDAGGIEDRVR